MRGRESEQEEVSCYQRFSEIVSVSLLSLTHLDLSFDTVAGAGAVVGGDLFLAFDAAAVAVEVLPAARGVPLVAVAAAQLVVNLAREEIAFDHRPQTQPLPERRKSQIVVILSHCPGIQRRIGNETMFQSASLSSPCVPSFVRLLLTLDTKLAR